MRPAAQAPATAPAPGWLKAMGEALATNDFVGCRAEFDRLNVLSEGQTSEADVVSLLERMLGFAEAGFAA